MIEAKSLFENLLFTTVRIEAILPNKSESIGTGFIFDYQKNDKHYMFIITNKHVVKESVEGIPAFTLSDGEKPILGKIFSITFPNFGGRWIGHNQEDIDVAVMPFAPVLNELSKKGEKIFFRAITPNLMPEDKVLKEDIDAVEDILFVGYPSNIYDTKNLLPVVRKGITATPISVGFEGKPSFLIDASIFPGSSGSPVFLCNVGSYSPKGKGLVVGSRIFFSRLTSCVFLSVHSIR